MKFRQVVPAAFLAAYATLASVQPLQAQERQYKIQEVRELFGNRPSIYFVAEGMLFEAQYISLGRMMQIIGKKVDKYETIKGTKPDDPRLKDLFRSVPSASVSVIIEGDKLGDDPVDTIYIGGVYRSGGKTSSTPIIPDAVTISDKLISYTGTALEALKK